MKIMGQFQQLSVKTMQIVYVLEAISSGIMSYYPASIFRGMLGKILFDKSCMKNEKNCDHCHLMRNCAYGTIFEPTSEMFAPHLMGKMKKITPPFVIEPPIFLSGKWLQGEKVQLIVTLFGEQKEHFYEVTEAIIKMGKIGIGKNRIQFHVNEIYQLFLQKPKLLLFSKEIFNVKSVEIENRTWITPSRNIHSLLIQIETPLRMTYQNQITKTLLLDVFIINVLRRCSTLIDLYSDESFDLNFYELQPKFIDSIKIKNNYVQWVDWQRYSSRLQREIQLGGLVGSFQIEGELSTFLPFLLCGSYAHIGKQTVFGLGKFTVYEKLSV